MHVQTPVIFGVLVMYLRCGHFHVYSIQTCMRVDTCVMTGSLALASLELIDNGGLELEDLPATTPQGIQHLTWFHLVIIFKLVFYLV